MSAPAVVVPNQKAGGGKLKIIIVAVVGIVAGVFAPSFLSNNSAEGKSGHDSKSSKGKHAHGAEQTAIVPFGDVIVNLAEERMTRYLRVKIVLEVVHEQEHEATEHLNKSRAALKNWLLGHMAGKTLKEVSGSVGMKRLQREIRERFEEVLYPEEPHPLRNVLFEEFVVQ